MRGPQPRVAFFVALAWWVGQLEPTMPQPQTIDEAIDKAARSPKRVQVGNQSVEQQSVDEQIKADQYLAAKQAATKKCLGLRFAKILPPGAG
jgi:hypothetical protein